MNQNNCRTFENVLVFEISLGGVGKTCFIK